MRNKVLITGVGGPAGKSALAYFKGNGVSVIGTDVREVEVVPDTFHLVPMAADPAFVAALLGIIRDERPSLFVPTSCRRSLAS